MERDRRTVEVAFEYGCSPSSWSFSGHPTSYECPIGTLDWVGLQPEPPK